MSSSTSPKVDARAGAARADSSGAAASGLSSATPSALKLPRPPKTEGRGIAALGRRRHGPRSASPRRSGAGPAAVSSADDDASTASPSAAVGASPRRQLRRPRASASAWASLRRRRRRVPIGPCADRARHRSTQSLAAGVVSSMPSSESKGSMAIAGSIGDSLSWPSASSEAAVAASRRIAELSSCSARRASSSGDGWCRKPAANWCSRRRMSSAALTNRRASSSVPWPIDLRARERVLERARQVREIGEADRRRAAGERMGERDRHFADRAVQLHRPLGDLGHQAARQLVGLVQVDVEERDADAQRADDLDVLVARPTAGPSPASWPTSRSTRPDAPKSAGAPVDSASPVERSSIRPATSSSAAVARRRGSGSAGRVARRCRDRGRPGRTASGRTARSVSVVCIASLRASSKRSNIAEASASVGSTTGGVLGGDARLDHAIERRQVELERHVLGLGLGSGSASARPPRRAQVEIGAARQVGRHADRQGDVGRRPGAAGAGERGRRRPGPRARCAARRGGRRCPRPSRRGSRAPSR